MAVVMAVRSDSQINVHIKVIFTDREVECKNKANVSGR